MFEITVENIVGGGIKERTLTLTRLRSIRSTYSIAFLGMSLCVLQAMDGFLTALGISRFGHQIEGNPFLRVLMEEYGHGVTLALTKSIAITIVIMLTFLAYRLPWVKKALGALTCIYLFGAVLPWTYILFLAPRI